MGEGEVTREFDLTRLKRQQADQIDNAVVGCDCCHEHATDKHLHQA